MTIDSPLYPDAEPTMILQFSEDDLLRELGAAKFEKGEFLWP